MALASKWNIFRPHEDRPSSTACVLPITGLRGWSGHRSVDGLAWCVLIWEHWQAAVSIHLQEPRAEVMETHTHTHSPVLIISDRRLAVASDNRAVSSSSFILLPHFAWLTCWLFRMDTYCLPLNWLSWLHRWSTLTRFIIYKLISMLADYIYNLSCWQVFEVGK